PAGGTLPASRCTCSGVGAGAGAGAAPCPAPPARCAASASDIGTVVARAAAPAAAVAAPLRKPRRSTEAFVDFAICRTPAAYGNENRNRPIILRRPAYVNAFLTGYLARALTPCVTVSMRKIDLALLR